MSHREMEARRFYIAEFVRCGGTIGAWSNRAYLHVLLELLSTSLQSDGLQGLLPELSATRTLRLGRSLCPRHLRDIVFMLSSPCSPPLCVTFLQSSNLKRYHSKLLKIYKKVLSLHGAWHFLYLNHQTYIGENGIHKT